ncbi:MAG: sulfotransferase, partial [bacterium]
MIGKGNIRNTTQFVFLTYLARSGSTLLSKKLSQFSNFGVGIEEDIEDNISKGCFKLQNEVDLDKYLDRIFLEVKFKNWNLNKVNLRTRLIDNFKFPLTYYEVLTEIFNLYFAGETKEVYIHKKGNYYLYWREVLKTFPNSKFIFIYRDPRAIFNSQNKNKNSQNKIMQKSIYTFAYSYKLAHKLLCRLNKRKNKLLVFKYEDLVINEDNIIKLIVDFLEVKNVIKSENNDYYRRIPQNQLHLHNNVKLEYNDNKRINAWKSELS